MLFPEGLVRVLVHGRPDDMRKSFPGLIALIKHALGQDPLTG
jgi:transposase